MKGHNPDMSGLKEGSAKKYPRAYDLVSQPGNAYGKTRSGLQPVKARAQSYNPDTSVSKR